MNPGSSQGQLVMEQDNPQRPFLISTTFSNFELSDDFLVHFKNLLEHSQGKIIVMG